MGPGIVKYDADNQDFLIQHDEFKWMKTIKLVLTLECSREHMTEKTWRLLQCSCLENPWMEPGRLQSM